MDLQVVWGWLSDPNNQDTLALLGGGVVVVAGGFWTVIRYAFRPKPAATGSDSGVNASDGSVAVGGDMKGNTVTMHAPANSPATLSQHTDNKS